MRNRSIALVLFVFCSFLLHGKDNAIRFASSIKKEKIKQHVVRLSDASMEGRLTGTIGQKKAAVYLMQQLKGMGALPFAGSYFQKFQIRETRPEKISFSVDGSALKFIKQFHHYQNFNNETIQNANMVFAGYGDLSLRDCYEGVDVQGAIVWMLGTKEDDFISPLEFRVKWAIDRGAKAVLVVDKDPINPESEHYLREPQLTLPSDTLQYKIPVLHVNYAVSDSILKRHGSLNLSKWLKKKRKKSKRMKALASLEVNIISADKKTENVFAFLPGGSLKNEIVVLCAHYDHLGKQGDQVYYGADDNATGCSALLEAARAYYKAAKNGVKPKRSILFLWFTGEEQGLLGSKYYTRHPLFPIAQVRACFNMDMVGRSDKALTAASAIYSIGSDFIEPQFKKTIEAANNKYVGFFIDYKHNDPSDLHRYYYRSDHYEFAKRGVPSVFFFSGAHEDYHTTRDTWQKVNFQKTLQVSRLLFYSSWQTANLQEMWQKRVKK